MTENEIYEVMLAQFQQETGYEMHTNADLAVRLRAAAAQIMSLYHYADHTYLQAFPQTAEGEALDLHGTLRGITRKPAKAAEGVLRFGISEPVDYMLAVPMGTVCLSQELCSFETTDRGYIQAGDTFVDIPAVAREPGRQGNAAAGTIQIMQSPPLGVESVTNPAAFQGGVDAESDEKLRERILGAYRGLTNGSNLAYYEQLALETPGVDRVTVIPKINGLGTVGVLVDSDSGTVTLGAVEEVQRKVNAQRELCVEVTVMAPEPVSVRVQANMEPKASCSLSQAVSAVREAIEQCFQRCQMGKTLYHAELVGSAMGTGMIDNIVFSAPLGDIVVEETQKPELLSLTLGGL